MKVYLIGNGDGKYKIGYTSRPIQYRLSEIQVGSSSELSVIAEYESENAQIIETALHNIYDHYNTSGEWFALPEIEILRFKETCNKFDGNFKTLKKMGNPWSK